MDKVKKRNFYLIAAAVSLIFLILLFIYIATSETICTKQDSVKAQLRLLTFVLQEYKKQKGNLPKESEGLQALVSAEMIRQEGLVDAWGKPLVYKCKTSDCSTVLLYSKGPNLVDEGGQNDDISIETNGYEPTQ